MHTLAEYAAQVEARLNELIPEVHQEKNEIGRMPRRLSDSMRYSLLAGGKRLRPAMLLACVEMLGGDVVGALDIACALEMIHTYSLIHDDLPGMDDDTLRRGKPTNHVVFGVGQAILAGDGLLNFAYETMLASALHHAAELPRYVAAAAEIARGAGVTGMVAGQVADVENAASGADAMDFIQYGKTAMMFMGAMRAGGQLANAGTNEMRALTAFGEHFGRLFQTSDDILDATGTTQMLGKSTGKDARDKKLTAVSVFTISGARIYAGNLQRKCHEDLALFDGRTAFFAQLIDQMAVRQY